MKIKRYLLYAIGEIFLIVIGILLALYISNRNVNQQYKSKIDNNIARVYDELEKNIEESRRTINELRYKDSLIYLVMNDSLKAEDYYDNINLSYLILQNHQYELENQAYQNLIQLNISDNRYNDELITNLKELNTIYESTMDYSDRMADFISDTAIPFLSENIESFGDLTYRIVVEKDALEYFMTSKEYKTYVGRYSIDAVRNQLSHNRRYYKKAIEIYDQISDQYDFVNKNDFTLSTSMIEKYRGEYILEKIAKDTFNIDYRNDSLLIWKRDDNPTLLIPLEERRFIVDGGGQVRYFVSFFENDVDTSEWSMRLQLLSDNVVYEKNK